MSDYRALYRKWRPVDFDDVSGQDAVTDILKYEVANGRISHAYLFCGSRGTGKTSCAKILAKAVNCLHPRNGNPCNACEACRSIDAGSATDVIEMDAASNNGVDNVRDMKDEIAFTPAVLKYRVYIIDEVHMMSGSAFNALLKTLEEPPSYVVFILATTEMHKLPTTIVSRCQRFDFRRIDSECIMRRLSKIAEAEGIDLTPDGARVIARAAQGGMRDAVSLLELCAGTHETVDASLVFRTVGTGNRENAYRLIAAVADADCDTVYSIVRDVVMSSGDLSVFWQEILDSYRDMMVVKSTRRAKEYLDLTEFEYERVSAVAEQFTMARLTYHTAVLERALADMQRAQNSKRAVAEIALTRMCDARSSAIPEAVVERLELLEKEMSMLRLGVGTAHEPSKTVEPVKESQNTPMKTAPAKEPENTPQRPAVREPASAQPKAAEPAAEVPTVYPKWHAALERIGELKRSLSVQFLNAKVYRQPPHCFTVCMASEFFATRLSSNAADLAILRGVLAEAEGCAPEEVTVTVRQAGNTQKRSPQDELDDVLR